MTRSMGLRTGDVSRACCRLSTTSRTASGSADLRSHTGAIVDQGHVGHCTTSAVKAVCGSLSAAGRALGFEPSHLEAYQIALRLDRADDYPGVPPKQLPPLRDIGSRITTMIHVVQRYGIGKSRNGGNDCTYDLAIDEQAIDVADIIASRPRVHAGAYEIPWNARADVRLALDAGIVCVCGGWVDTAFMKRSAFAKPAGSQDFSDRNGGGHAQMIIGYRTLASGETLYLIQGSWGEDWAGDAYPGCTWVTQDFIDQQWSVYAMRVNT